MPRLEPEIPEPTYPLRTAALLTGLSPDLLRAWERRHQVVSPLRTPGGTRRYTAADLERLRWLKSAVNAGHRISQLAGLDLDELKQRAAAPDLPATGVLEEILSALDELASSEARRLLSLQLSALGPARFAREIAAPLAQAIGERWADDRLGIASEHLGTSVLRALLGSALTPSAASLLGPRVVFATLSGERHELGLQMAALTAMGAGANPIYLGVDLPGDDMLQAVERSRSAALALSVVTPSSAEASRTIHALRAGLPTGVPVWVGGSGAGRVNLPDGAEHIADLEALERRVALLASDRRAAR